MLLSYLRDHWQELLGTPYPDEVNVATITSCRLDHGNDLVLIFVDRGRSPDYIMKIGRSPRYAFKLEREFEALQWFFSREDPKVPAPRPHHLGLVDERTFIIQEAIRGISLARLLTERGLTRFNRELLTEAIDLLVEIHRHPAESDRERDFVLDPRLDLGSRDRAKLADLERLLAKSGRRLYAHGDYWPLNLLARENRIVGVIDWEFSVGRATIPADIVWFLVNAAYVLCRRQDPGISIDRAFREVFFREHPYSPFMRDLYERYRGALGLERDLFLPLLEVTLAEMAQRELIAYGSSGKMDEICATLLRYTLGNEEDLQI